MVVPPMQRISGNNYGTYRLNMPPFMTSMLGLPCRPCSRPWQLKFDDYLLLVAILGVLGMAHLHSGNTPSFNIGIFALYFQWVSWGTKSLLTASAESAGKMFNYSLQQNY